MLIKQEQISPCEVELEFEIAPDRVASAFDDTYAELGKKVTVPGFRKGRAPREVLRSFLDKEMVRREVADKLIETAYNDALSETKLEPYRPADVELVQFEVGSPMLFKIKVPLAPKVELGEYVGLEIERRVPPVLEEHVQQEIQRIIEERTPYEQVTDRELREGDVARVDLKREDEPESKSTRQIVKVGENLPDFDRGVVGMRIGEEKAIQITYPDDYGDESLRGRTVSLLVTLHEIHSRQLPELTDEWVKQTFAPDTKEQEESNPDSVIDTVDKLKAAVRGALERAAQTYADEMVREQVVDKVVSGSTVCFPEVLVEEAIE
ncbi:MAG: trigger factor, partial [Armatimonadota bacterium]